MSRKKYFNPNLSKSQMAEFEILVKQNMKRAYYSALGLVGSHDSAMELSQEAFLKAYKGFKSFDHSRNFFTWYYKILKNLCLNFFRDTKNRKEDSFKDFVELRDLNDNPSELTEKKEKYQMLQKALSMLEMEDREILILREFEGRSYKEISELLEIPSGTVMSRLYYARKKLAKYFEGIIK